MWDWWVDRVQTLSANNLIDPGAFLVLKNRHEMTTCRGTLALPCPLSLIILHHHHQQQH